jgi:predicted nucleotidyltransferase
MLPDFLPDGNMPAGVYQATMDETGRRLGSTNRTRQILFQRLERIRQLAQNTQHLARFIVFGSFVTAKPDPNDLDVFLLMDDAFNSGQLHGETQILFDHLAADAHFGCSVFWVRRLAAFGGEQATIEHWQICRGGGSRGIIEVIEATP